jgi:hypothetical protein
VRIKQAPFPQIASSGTPEGTDHWLYELLIDKPLPKSRVIYGDTRDNARNLGDDYIPTLEASFDQVMLDAYLKGLWVNMRSSRFYYAYDPARNHAPNEWRRDERVLVSLDFNVAPMCATLWHVEQVTDKYGNPLYFVGGQPMRRLCAFDQIEILNDARTDQMANALYAKGLNPRLTTIYPDPAGKQRSTKGPPDIETLKARGFTDIKVKLVAPEFRKRQLAVNAMLEDGLITANKETCPGIIRDWVAVERDPDDGSKIKKNPKLTHHSDGLDYMVDIEFPYMGVKPEGRVLKYR